MPKRRMIIVGLAVVVVAAAVTVGSVVADRPKPACACSIEPNLRGPARDAGSAFTWSRPPDTPVVIIAIERNATGPRIGAVAVP